MLAVNFLVFQVAWFSTVLGAANELPWVGPAVIACAIAFHLAVAQRPQAEFILVVACGAVGAVVDSVLVAAGWVSYPNGLVVAGAAPYWIVAMWMLFATTLNVSMGWLKNRRALSVVFGLIGGPLAYYSGHKLGAIEFNDLVPAMVALGVAWGAAMPLLLMLAARFDGFGTPSRASIAAGG